MWPFKKPKLDERNLHGRTIPVAAPGCLEREGGGGNDLCVCARSACAIIWSNPPKVLNYAHLKNKGIGIILWGRLNFCPKILLASPSTCTYHVWNALHRTIRHSSMIYSISSQCFCGGTSPLIKFVPPPHPPVPLPVYTLMHDTNISLVSCEGRLTNCQHFQFKSKVISHHACSCWNA